MMNELAELRMEEYNRLSEKYKKLEAITVELLEENLKNKDLRPMHITHRIKTAESSIGKLERKPDKYKNLSALNDFLGIRIICYFTDQVDESASIIEKLLDVDTELSSDKRELIAPTTFGYLSLHYICSLPNVRREFSRVAGLLEIADETFLRIRNSIQEYEAEVREKISTDTADDMPLDLVSLRAYLELSPNMHALLEDIAAINGSKILDTDPESYLQLLSFFNLHTLGELNTFVAEGHEDAVYFAKKALLMKK